MRELLALARSVSTLTVSTSYPSKSHICKLSLRALSLFLGIPTSAYGNDVETKVDFGMA